MNPWCDNQSGPSTHMNPPFGQPIRSIHPNEPFWDNQSGLSTQMNPGGTTNQVNSPKWTLAVKPIRSLQSHKHWWDNQSGPSNHTKPRWDNQSGLFTQMNPGGTTNRVSPLTWIRLRRRLTAPPLPRRTLSCSPPTSSSYPGTPGGRSVGSEPSAKHSTNININGYNKNFVGSHWCQNPIFNNKNKNPILMLFDKRFSALNYLQNFADLQP